MNGALERLGGWSARRWWVVIVAWIAILGGLLAARHAFGGEYVNNYTISGSDSAAGLDVLNKTFPQQGGYGGQIVFHAKNGTVTAQQSAVNQAVSNISKLPDVIKAVSPFASGNTGAVSKDGTIAYASVGWDVNPDSLDAGYLNQLNTAVAPATQAGLQVAYGGDAGQIGQQTSDIKSEVIGLALALVLLLFMFGSVIAAAIPLVSAIFSVLSGLALLTLIARVVTVPTTAPTIATLPALALGDRQRRRAGGAGHPAVLHHVFGLSVDYEVFLLSRVHEAWLETGDAQRAVATGIGATARVITTAAAIMIAVFTSFVLDPDPTVKMLAIGMAFAVLIDASLVRMCLVPSIMSLLGKHAWWMPRWLEPIVPHLDLEGSPAEPAAPEPALAGAGHSAEPPAGHPSQNQARTTHRARNLG